MTLEIQSKRQLDGGPPVEHDLFSTYVVMYTLLNGRRKNSRLTRFRQPDLHSHEQNEMLYILLSQEDDALIVGVMERDGAVFNEQGIDIDGLHKHIHDTGGVKGFHGFTPDSDSVLTSDCDILIPAALEGVITKENASDIQARIIIEAANGPVTFTANEMLRDRRCLIIPDLYANAGGVTVSYFEWVKNIGHIRFGRMQRRQHERQTMNMVAAIEEMTGSKFPEQHLDKIIQGPTELDLVRSGLDDVMREGYQVISAKWHSDTRIPDLRTAAMMIAIERIRDSYESLGI